MTHAAAGGPRPLRVLVVDDEAPARARLRRLLAQLEREHEVGDACAIDVVAESPGGEDAVDRIRALRPDLVLLDIHMPGLDGFGVIDAVGPGAMPLVAFTTAYDEHAIRAFEVHALDYLLKPVCLERLASVVRRACRLAGADAGDLAARLAALLQSFGQGAPAAEAGGYLQRLMVHHDERAFLLPVARIHRISADRNTVRLHVAGAVYPLRTPIGTLEARLDPAEFLRINRGDIVRLDAVREMHPWSHGDYHVVLADGTRLVWSRRYRSRTGERFGPG